MQTYRLHFGVLVQAVLAPVTEQSIKLGTTARGREAWRKGRGEGATDGGRGAKDGGRGEGRVRARYLQLAARAGHFVSTKWRVRLQRVIAVHPAEAAANEHKFPPGK